MFRKLKAFMPVIGAVCPCCGKSKRLFKFSRIDNRTRICAACSYQESEENWEGWVDEVALKKAIKNRGEM